MTILSLLSAFACLFCLESGIGALVLNKGHRLNRIVFVLDLLLALWSLDAAFDYSVAKSEALGLYVLCSPAWNFFLALILHLCLCLPAEGRPVPKALLALLYVPAIVLNGANVAAVYLGIPADPGALEPFLPPGPWRLLYWLYYALYFLLSLASLLVARRRTRDPLERKRLAILVASLVLPCVGGAATDAVLPLLVPGLPALGILWSMLWVAGVRYATARYAFISPFRNIADSRRFFAAFLEHSRDGIVVTGPDGTILLWNRAMEGLTGRKARDVLGGPQNELGLGLEQAQGTWVVPLRLRGQELWLQASSFSFWLKAGRLARGVIVRDVTTERRKELEAQEARERHETITRLEAVGTLAAGLAHEFNNILAGIKGILSVLKLGDGAGGLPSRLELSQGLDGIDALTNRGGDLVGQLVALGGSPRIERRRLCLGQVAAQVQALAAASLDPSVRLVMDGPLTKPGSWPGSPSSFRFSSTSS